MSLLRRVRGEVAGAWRSVGYDLGRRPAPPVDGPDVTSTGMGTFPGSLIEQPGSPPRADARPPRRFVAVTAFCALAALGAGGSYVAATSVFAEEPPSVPAAAPAPVEFAAPETDSAGMGAAGPASTAGPRTTPPAVPGQPEAPTAGGVARVVVRPDGTVVTSAPRTGVTRPGRPVTRPITDPSGPECHCTPPVPTPTVPSATAAPSDPGSPAPTGTSDSPGSPSVDPSATADPDPSVTPSGSAEPAPDRAGRRRDSDRRHHRRHHD